MATAAELAEFYSVACEVTGQQDPSKVTGALRALAEAAEASRALAHTNVSLASEVKGAKVSKLVDLAVREMKLEPNKKAWALSLGMKDPKELEGYLATCQPKVATQTTRHVAEASRAQQGTLGPLETQLAQRMGVTPAQVEAQRARNEAYAARRRAQGLTGDEDDEED